MILSKLLDIAVKNTLKQYFSPEENGVLISYMVIEKSQFLIWGVYYSPPCSFMQFAFLLLFASCVKNIQKDIVMYKVASSNRPKSKIAISQ